VRTCPGSLVADEDAITTREQSASSAILSNGGETVHILCNTKRDG